MTRLSYPGAPARAVLQRLGVLARRSLFSVGIGSLLAGCLVAEPPSPSNPERSLPMIDFRNTVPLVTQITSVRGPTPQAFSVGVRSEDRGDAVYGLLYRNYSLEGEEYLTFDFVPASTFADADRTLIVQWNVPERVILSGCQQITMVVTHESNVERLPSGERGPRSPTQVALATWWLHVNPDPDRPDDLGVCPRSLSPQ